MLAQYTYCKRLGYMEWVQGEFESNKYVEEGRYNHKNVDVERGKTKLAKSAEKNKDEKIHVSSVYLSDAKLGLVGKMDLAEFHGRHAVPVEYKRGKVPDVPERANEDHLIQLCAQGLLLRANGYESTRGVIYYTSARTRVDIQFDDHLIARTLQTLHDMRETCGSGLIPPPLVDSPKCYGCSLVGICLPDETNMLADLSGSSSDDGRIRRMYPMRSDAYPLYVQEQGAYIGVSGDRIYVRSKDGEKQQVRMIDISEIAVFGNVQISSQAIRKLCDANVPICYFSYGGWFVGITHGMSHKNVELRIRQHETGRNKKESMKIARQMVYGKIRNSITMLRRNNQESPTDILDEMGSLADQAKNSTHYERLLGIEGLAARKYFENFNGMIRSDVVEFSFTDRNRRPPADHVNAILSFMYALLVRQVMVTVFKVGFDPYLGFLHMPKYGKPSLALDIMEEFRPILADSASITVINNGEITKEDFVETGFGTNLNETGRKKVIRAYERRLDTTVRHDILGYSASYKRIIETQSRILARHITGEIPQYIPFKTR